MDDQPTLKNNPCGINLDAKVKNIKLYTLTIFCHIPLQTQKIEHFENMMSAICNKKSNIRPGHL